MLQLKGISIPLQNTRSSYKDRMAPASLSLVETVTIPPCKTNQTGGYLTIGGNKKLCTILNYFSLNGEQVVLKGKIPVVLAENVLTQNLAFAPRSWDMQQRQWSFFTRAFIGEDVFHS